MVESALFGWQATRASLSRSCMAWRHRLSHETFSDYFAAFDVKSGARDGPRSITHPTGNSRVRTALPQPIVQGALRR